MALRCKPGDLAVIVASCPLYGALVSVLHAAPFMDFMLPDGHNHVGVAPGSWVVESLGKPFDAPCGRDGVTTRRRETRFGVCEDHQLRPLRDADGEDEVLRIAGKPQPINAAKKVGA